MELLEYQAKELFRMVGIPILPSQTIKDARKIKQLEIPYPVVLKSQVRSGGRGKAGGVRFVANTIDAIAATRTIFNLSILGEYPEVILAEAHYNAQRELFLAIVLDYDLQCPVLLGSAFGGMNVDSLLSNLQQVVIDGDFSLFEARRLAANMGLTGKLICSVSEIIAKMHYLFQNYDLDLVEINPLGINREEELMALDGKITINDYALARQPIIESLSFSRYQQKISKEILQQHDYQANISWRWLDWHNSCGKIAIISNSVDSALLIWDLLHQNNITPACGVIIENSLGEESGDLEVYQEQIGQILPQVASIKGVEAILVNILATDPVSRAIVLAIADHYESLKSDLSPSIELDQQLRETKSLVLAPQLILRVLHEDHFEDITCEYLSLTNSLEAAISQAIAILAIPRDSDPDTGVPTVKSK
ncbi:ATP-grasp domain protein [Chondrocystis sp. NIES-4102]|nr:ATP-grasp domain protein [Chondrocystis sp. NIES-4102]